MSPEPPRLPTIPALDHPRGGQIMFRDAGGGSTELSTMGDREERLPVGLSILLMLGLTALAGRFWFSLRLCSVRLVAVLNGCLPRSLRLFRHVAAPAAQ
jgi:hypothetical protein